MDLKITTWNIRSMNKLKKQKEVKKLIAEEGIQVCAILETHVKPQKLTKVCEVAFENWSWISNVVHSQNGCRIVVSWDRDMVNVMLIHTSRQHMVCMIENLSNNVKFLCCFVYAANTGRKRKELWRDIISAKSVTGGMPWLLL